MGRPTKLTEEIVERFSSEVRKGLSLSYTCDLLGVTRTSYANWMDRGSKATEAAAAGEEIPESEAIYADFFLAVKKAYAEFIRHAGAIVRGGGAGWQGMAWWLERTNREFMPKQQVQADDEGKVTVVIGGKPAPRKPLPANKATADHGEA